MFTRYPKQWYIQQTHDPEVPKYAVGFYMNERKIVASRMTTACYCDSYRQAEIIRLALEQTKTTDDYLQYLVVSKSDNKLKIKEGI